MAGIGFTLNYDVASGNGLGPKTTIISLAKTNMPQADLNAVVQALSMGGTAGTDDAVSVAGVGAFVAGVTDLVHIAVQGTGVLTAAANYRGVTGVTMAIVTSFVDRD